GKSPAHRCAPRNAGSDSPSLFGSAQRPRQARGLLGCSGRISQAASSEPGVITVPFVTVDNTRFFYRMEGSDRRPVLALSHSLGCDHSMWDAQVADLLPHFRILRYDTRGHGASDVPPGDYSIERLARDVLGIADALHVHRFAFCGLSLGGMIGQWLAGNIRGRVAPGGVGKPESGVS